MSQASPLTIIAAAGRDAQNVRSAGLPCLHLCTALTSDGSFTVLTHPISAKGDLLGIADQGGSVRSPSLFAASACRLAKSRGSRGILADFQRPELSDTVRALDAEAHRLNLSFWIPIELADCAPHGILIAETAISGGSLSVYFSELAERYGADRIAAQLVRSCSKFSIPSESPDGTPLSMEQAQEIQRETGAIPFFSRELCAKYFTCTENSSARFILFDDEETLRSKQTQLTEAGIMKQILLYPDAAALGLIPDRSARQAKK